jgi:hypothetical protein
MLLVRRADNGRWAVQLKYFSPVEIASLSIGELDRQRAVDGFAFQNATIIR